MSKFQENKTTLFNKINSFQTLSENEEKIKNITDNISTPFNRLNVEKENFMDVLTDTQNQLMGSDNNEMLNFLRKILKKSFSDSSKITKILIEELIGTVNCNIDRVINGEIRIKRNDIDLYDVLNLNPDELPGKIVYEKNTTGVPRSFNRFIQKSYLKPQDTIVFNTINNNKLFDLSFDVQSDEFVLSFDGVTIGDFLSGYYGSIELYDGKGLVADIIESMFATFSESFTSKHIGTKIYFNRIFEKLSRICGLGQYSGEENMNDDLSNFGNEEGGDGNLFIFDDEDRRYYENEKNLKINGLFELQDCNNYQVKINQDIVRDSILDGDYDDFDEGEIFEELVGSLSSNIIDNENPDLTLDLGVDFPSVNTSIINRFIKEIPNAMMSKVISLKAILPYIVVNKVTNSTNDTIDASSNAQTQDAENFVLKNERYVQRVGVSVFSLFRTEMINEIKKRLSRSTQTIIRQIIKQKLKSQYVIILSLIGAIRALVNVDVVTCAAILEELKNMLNLRTGVSNTIPTPLLYGAYTREGVNSTRAHLNTIEELRKIGYNLNDLPDGSPNKHLASLKMVNKGMLKEFAENSSIEFISKPATVISPVGGVVPYVSGKGIIITSF